VKTFFETLTKSPDWFLTYFDIATAWITTRDSNSFSHAFNDDYSFLLVKKHVNIKIIDLNIKIAKFKFKKPGEINNSLWIMLIKPIQRVKLTFVCMLSVFLLTH
jgi:hypothetical protein